MVLLEILRANQLQGFARAESCFVEGAREMFVNKQYVAPLLYNVPYFDKPPFFYWIIISSYKLFGVSLLHARAVSIAAAALVIITIALFVKRILGEKTALLSAIILATNIGFCEFAAIAMPDMLLCLFTSLATFCAYMYLFKNEQKQASYYLPLASIFFAFGWMTKGPVAVLIPCAAIFISMLVVKQKPNLSMRDFALGLMIFLAILIPWHLAVYKNYGFSAFDWLYIQGNIGRFMGEHSLYNFGHKPTYILINLLGNFLPWTIVMIPAFCQLVIYSLGPQKYRPENKFLLLMMFWALLNTLFFSFSHSNWGYYSLAIYPALSIITAHFLIGLGSRFSSKKLAALYLTIAFGFFIGMLIYIFVCLPAKAKNNTFLNFAGPIKNIPTETPLFFDADLAGQYLLVDYMIFESQRIPGYCDQKKLTEIISEPKPFAALLLKSHFDKLSSDEKSKLMVFKDEAVSWLNFPGCKLIKEAQPGKPILLTLVRHGI